jgi:hypothetical protein
MPTLLLIVVSLLAYVAGLVLVLKATPRLLVHHIDEGIFMGAAMVDVLAGILLFTAVATPLVVLTADTPQVIGGHILAFLLLVGILLVAGATALRCFRWSPGSVALSRLLAGLYCLMLLVAALFCMVLMFLPA